MRVNRPGAGKFEIRGEVNTAQQGGQADTSVITIIAEDGVVEGLPANISPGANPPLYSFVAHTNSFFDDEDLNISN